MAYSY